MNNSRLYSAIIASFQVGGKNFIHKKQPGENHHIVPKSLGGSNSKSNIVRLSYRAHFICHRLLVKMHEGEARAKMALALFRLSHKNQKLTSLQYAKIKEEVHKANSFLQRRRVDNGTHHFLGGKIQRKSRGKKRGPQAVEHRQKISVVQQKNICNGTHHFLSSRLQSELGKRGGKTKSKKKDAWTKKQIELAKTGRHSTQKIEFRENNRQKQKMRVENGTHHLLSGEIQKRSARYQWAKWRQDHNKPAKKGDSEIICDWESMHKC